MPKTTAFALVLVTVLSPTVLGQDTDARDTRYGEITLLAAPAFSIGTNSLSDLWQPGTGISLALESPFTIGRLGLGYQVTRFHGDGTSVPDFYAHRLNGRWGIEVPARRWLRLYGGVSAGAWSMRFRGPRSDEGSPVETELTAGVQGRLSICVPGNPLCLFGSLDIARVFTEPRITLRTGSFGASVSLATRQWMRKILDGRPQSRAETNDDAASRPSRSPGIAQPESNRFDAEHAILRSSANLGRQVITAEEMRRAGLTRLGELFTLADLWTSTTTDYFSWWATPLGQSGPMNASYSILVGDQWLELGPGAVSALDRIGLGIEQLDSVAVSTSPQLVAGRFTSAGMVRLFPKEEHSGPGVHLHGMVGNPTGDPGPHWYRQEHVSNVDRVGEEMAVRFFAGKRRWELDAGYIQGFHNLLDSRIVARTRSAATDAPSIEFNAPSLRFRVGENGGHTVQVLASRLDDFRFMPLQAREVPLRTDWIHAGLNGTLWTGKGSSVRYRTSADLTRLDALPNRLDIDDNNRGAVWRADVELTESSGGSAGPLVGIGIDLETTDYGYLGDDATALRLRAYGRRGWCMAAHTCVSVETLASMSDAGPGVHVRGIASRKWNSSLWTNAGLSVERAPETFVSTVFGVGGVGEPTEMERRLSADVTVAARLSDRWSLDGIVLIRAQRPGRILDDPEGVVASNLIPDITTVVSDSNAVGYFGGIGLTVRWRDRNAGAKGSYSLQKDIKTTPGMERRWALVPNHRFRQEFWFRLGDELTAQLSAEVRSPISIPNLVAEDNEAQPISQGSAFVTDLTVLKWFWGRRARASVRLRDLMNDRTPAHPLGAAPGLTLLIQGDVVVSYRGTDRL